MISHTTQVHQRIVFRRAGIDPQTRSSKIGDDVVPGFPGFFAFLAIGVYVAVHEAGELTA
jgi:hypothetical protein